MKKNIGAHLNKIRTFILSKTNAFTSVLVGRPLENIEGINLFFTLVNNSAHISDDVDWVNRKKALLDFYIIGWSRETAEVEIYEKFDELINAITGNETVTIWDFIFYSIKEWNQSWILRDATDRPFIIAQVYINYQYRY